MTKIEVNFTIIYFTGVPFKLLNSDNAAIPPGNNSSLCLHLQDRLMPRLPGSSPGQSPPVNPDSWLITLQRNPSDSGRRWWIKLLASQPVLPDTSSRNSGLEGRTYSRNLCRKAGIHHCLRILRRKECLKKDISKNEKKGRLSLFLVWRGAFFVKVWLVCSRQVKKTKFMRDKVKHSSWTGKGGGEGEREGDVHLEWK